MQPASESATVKAPPPKISPEEFAFETRFVVLNYLGQVQARSSSEGSFSSSGSGSDRHRLLTQSSSSSGSSHARPSSVSPRPPSVSPRPSVQGDDGDSLIVGAQAYDAKQKALQSIAEKVRSQDAKRLASPDKSQKEYTTADQQKRISDQILLADIKEAETDSTDFGSDDGRKKISEILEKRSREAKVLAELKNLAKARIEEIRENYEILEAERLERQKKLEAEERRKKQQEFYNQFRFKQIDTVKPKTDQQDKESADSPSSDHSSLTPDSDRASRRPKPTILAQVGGGMTPQMVDDAPTQNLREDSLPTEDTSLPFDPDSQLTGNLPEYARGIPSPTRPSNLDGLHKTSDVLSDNNKKHFRYPPPVTQRDASPTTLKRMGDNWPQPKKPADRKDESPSKRYDIPKPPAPSREKSPGKRDDIPRPPSQQKSSLDDHSSGKDGEYGRQTSKESAFSDGESPTSDISSLNWSQRSAMSGVTSSRSSIVNLDQSQVKALVKTSVLPEVAVPLQEEITEQWQQWEKEYDREPNVRRKSSIRVWKKRQSLRIILPEQDTSSHSDSLQGMSPMTSVTGPLSPESEVARRLGVIGDRIQEEMGHLLDKAFNDVMAIPREEVTYEVLNRVVEDDRLLENTSGWKQVRLNLNAELLSTHAMIATSISYEEDLNSVVLSKVAVLLAFSQRLTIGLLQKGERGLGKLMDFSVRLIEDKAAEFIINQGGWGAISEIDVSPLGSPGPDFPPDYVAPMEYPDGEPPMSADIGMNAAGSLLSADPSGSAVGAVGGVYISDNFGSGAVGGVLHRPVDAAGLSDYIGFAPDGVQPMSHVDGSQQITGAFVGNDVQRSLGNLVTDGTRQDGLFNQGGASGASYGDSVPDLLKGRPFNAQEMVDKMKPEIRMMRSVSQELSREAEEAQTHRFITRLTWGSIAVVVFAVGLTLLWKLRSRDNT